MSRPWANSLYGPGARNVTLRVHVPAVVPGVRKLRHFFRLGSEIVTHLHDRAILIEVVHIVIRVGRPEAIAQSDRELAAEGKIEIHVKSMLHIVYLRDSTP